MIRWQIVVLSIVGTIVATVAATISALVLLGLLPALLVWLALPVACLGLVMTRSAYLQRQGLR